MRLQPGSHGPLPVGDITRTHLLPGTTTTGGFASNPWTGLANQVSHKRLVTHRIKLRNPSKHHIRSHQSDGPIRPLWHAVRIEDIRSAWCTRDADSFCKQGICPSTIKDPPQLRNQSRPLPSCVLSRAGAHRVANPRLATSSASCIHVLASKPTAPAANASAGVPAACPRLHNKLASRVAFRYPA